MKTLIAITLSLAASAAHASPALDCRTTLGSGRFNTTEVTLLANHKDGPQPVLFQYTPSDPWMANLELAGELRYTDDLSGLELHLFYNGQDVDAGPARIHDGRVDLTFREKVNLVPPGSITLTCR